MNYAFIKDYIGRWRHTRGYGVHSPLAYRIVKDCIRPDRKYGFYTDSFLDFEFHEERKALRNAKMTIRLINLIRPKRIWYPNGDRRLCTALKMAFPSIYVATQKECPKNVDLIISCGKRNPKEMWEKMSDVEECCMVIFGKELESMEGATLLICSKVYTIAIRRIGMDFLCYRV